MPQEVVYYIWHHLWYIICKHSSKSTWRHSKLESSQITLQPGSKWKEKSAGMVWGSRRWRRQGVEYARGYPPPQPTRGSGGVSWAPPAGSGAEPRSKTILVHSEGARTALVAMHATEMT